MQLLFGRLFMIPPNYWNQLAGLVQHAPCTVHAGMKLIHVLFALFASRSAYDLSFSLLVW
jgi:hypothetical protein